MDSPQFTRPSSNDTVMSAIQVWETVPGLTVSPGHLRLIARASVDAINVGCGPTGAIVAAKKCGSTMCGYSSGEGTSPCVRPTHSRSA